jgi:mannose-6-phosphate isomerase-like protein (cupin superfamily)
MFNFQELNRMADLGYILADWEKAKGAATSEGYIKPLIASKNVSVAALEIAPGDEVLPHNHDGLPYFEFVLYVVEGNLEIIFRDKRVPIKKGMAITADPNEHGWVNRTEETVKALMIHSPPPLWQSAEEFLEKISRH